MKRVLLVDDDPLVLKLYQDGLIREGHQVETAGDGFAAMRLLREGAPDAVVLDLMMPKLSGLDVLRFIRSQSSLARLPVIVLSNSYVAELSEGAEELGVQKAFLKARCNPQLLGHAIEAVVDGKPMPPGEEDTGQVFKPESARRRSFSTSGQTEFRTNAREEFLANAPALCASLRALFEAFRKAGTTRERELRLQDLYRKVHFITANAGITDCRKLARIAAVFEAMLFMLLDRTDEITASALRTMGVTIDFFEMFFEQPETSRSDPPPEGPILAVDDDPLTTHLLISALRQAQLPAVGIQDPVEALESIRKNQYSLVLLDIEMPGLDGFQLCQQLRAIPGYERVPVIFVTGRDDFESRNLSQMCGGQDFIAKPIVPLELTVKVVTYLLWAELEN